MTELQTLRAFRNTPPGHSEINHFAVGSSSSPFNHLRSNNYDQQHQHLKLSFPKFNGEDPTGWIYKAEQYFEFKNITTGQQVQVASFHLEGVALKWHRWLARFRGPLTWDEFTKAILHRFGPTDYENPSEALSQLKQTSIVAAYQEAFEKLSHQVDDLPENFLIGCFIAGLKYEIRIDVKIKQPQNLADAIGVARLIEEQNQLTRRPTQLPHSEIIPKVHNSGLKPTAGLLGPHQTRE